MKRLLLIAMCLPMLAQGQILSSEPDNFCGTQAFISQFDEKALVVCFEEEIATCFAKFPATSGEPKIESQNDRPLGNRGSNSIITIGMDGSLWAKQQCREARAAGDDATAFLWQQDFLYWATVINVGRGLDVLAAGVYGQYDTELNEAIQKRGIQEVLLLQGLYGLPNFEIGWERYQ